MRRKSIRTVEIDPRAIRSALIAAQVLALFVYVMGAGFLLRTTGGSVFLFSLAAPVLILAAILFLAGVAIYRYFRRQSLFAFALFESGDVLFRQGDPGDFAYFIQEGEVEVFRTENAVETVVARLSEGHHFGETALISEAPQHVTARACTRVRVAMLGKTKFLHMLQFVHPAQDDVMRAMNQRAVKQAAKRAKTSAQIREDQSA